MSCSPPSWSFLNYLDENKFFTCITSLTFFIIGIFIFILNSYTVFEKRKIPRAVRPSAPFGNIKEVVHQETSLFVFLWKYYNKFNRKKCKLGGFFTFFRPGILLVDSAFSNKICLNETDIEDVFPGKKSSVCKEVFDLSEERLTKDFVQGFKETEKRLLSSLTGNSCKLSDALYKYLIETSCLIFGLENSLLLTNTIDRARQKYTSSFSNLFQLSYPYFPKETSYKIFRQIIENTIVIRKKTDVNTTKILENISDVLNNTKDDSNKIFKELFDIFIDNIVHSHSTILWCLYEISRNSNIQDELLGEIRRYKKENESLNFQTLEELSFLDAIVKETFRKYPPVPTEIKKCKNEVSTEFGFKLPKNSLVFLSIFGIHHDPLNYENPECFDPDRFFEDKFKQDLYLPFGYGVKTDIGLNITGILVKMFLLSVFSNFKIKLEKKEYSIEYDTKKFNVYPKEPVPVLFEPI